MPKIIELSKVPGVVEDFCKLAAKQLASPAKEVTMISCFEINCMEDYQVLFKESGLNGRKILTHFEQWEEADGSIFYEVDCSFKSTFDLIGGADAIESLKGQIQGEGFHNAQ